MDMQITPKKCEGCHLAKMLETAIQLNRQIEKQYEKEFQARMVQKLFDLSLQLN